MNRRDVLGALILTSSMPRLVGSAFAARAASGQSLVRRTPESQGISSGAIEAFLDAIDAHKLELHSLMILRHGAVVAEGWWAPHQPDAPHATYSVSKTFTSTAIGLAVADGRLATSTKLVDLFPDKLPAVIDQRLARLRVSHLLNMATGHGPEAGERVVATEDWVQSFLAEPLLNEPGSQFVYENTASYMLSAIVQKLYGTTLVEFLDKRLFAPLGIATPSWGVCPRGINTGGWGLSLPSEAMARLGQLYLDNGRWNGKQLIPATWIAEASVAHIEQRPNVPVTVKGIEYKDPDAALAVLKASSDWYQGYGYQIWRGRYSTYRADGAFGQLVIVMPEQQGVIVTTASADASGILDAAWEHLLPAMQEAPLASSRSAQRRLRDRLTGLKLACPVGRASTPAAASLADRTFKLTDNPLGARSLSFAWGQDTCTLTLNRADGPVSIPFGFGQWVRSRVSAPGLVPWMALFGIRVIEKLGSDIALAGAFAWKDDQTLTLRLLYTETPHHHLVTVRSTDDGLTFEANDVFGPISQFSGRAQDI